MITQYKFIKTKIEGAVIIVPFISSDQRGEAVKEYSKEVFLRNGYGFEPKETMLIKSKKGTLRGLHFQRVKEQEKLVRCVDGNIWTAIVDIRRESKTFGEWINVDINYGKEALIPKGCALGTLAMEDSLISCMYGEKYYKEYDSGIIWNDSTLKISWPIGELGDEIILSDKDAGLQTFHEFLREDRRNF